MADAFRKLGGRRNRPEVDSQSAFALWQVEVFPPAVSSNPTVALAGVEASDVAAFTVRNRHRVTLAGTEASDTASFSVAGRQRVALGATEGADTAAFAAGTRVGTQLAGTEAPDSASFSLDVLSGTLTVVLAGTEAPDTASFSLVGEVPQPISWDQITKQRIVRGPRPKTGKQELDEILEKSFRLPEPAAPRKEPAPPIDSSKLARVLSPRPSIGGKLAIPQLPSPRPADDEDEDLLLLSL